MTADEFRRTLSAAAPPAGSDALRALWHDARGAWEEAHEIAQAIDDANGAWIHAYLHRKEGDLANARYWYAKAGKEPATGPLDAEWEQIVAAQAP
jgi:hypothetical protein